MLNWSNVIHFASKGKPEPSRRVEKTDDEWKSILGSETYQIARLKGTERAGTGELCHAHDAGLYECVCCGATLFDSTIKFESGSGWPSFTQPFKEDAIKYEKDVTFGMIRVEVMCNVCDCHLGHVFPDGPAPSGLRYCVNSASIKLVKEKQD